CPARATSAGGVVGADAAAPTSGPGHVTGCMGHTGAVDGTVTVAADPATKQGYVVQDGRPSNPNLLAGYLGVDTQHTLTLVGCAGGDYKPGAKDEWNQTPTGST